MKKTEIATKVFEVMDAEPLVGLIGGTWEVEIADLAGLALVPWFCDISVQWALRLGSPGRPLERALLKKVAGSFITETNAGTILIGVPGDGIEPSMHVLLPLAEAVAQVVQPGMVLELAAANLGVVKRDWDAKAETNTLYGNQRYLGTLDGQGHWVIRQATPVLTLDALTVALGCGRMVARNGPWEVTDKSEAFAVMMQWLQSREANVNPLAVRQFIAMKNGAFTNADAGMTRKLCGLGLAFFRHRLADGPFRWPEPGPSRYPIHQLEEVARTVVG